MRNIGGNLDSVRSAIRVVATSERERPAAAGEAERPVVTISREEGVNAAVVARRLVERLNERRTGDPPWLAYDRELVERVAQDHDLAEDLVARLDERDKSWFEHLTAGFTGSATGTDIAMKTARTIRALAWVGRSVIVGRGGQCILTGMKHVVHVRLIAPLDWRIEQFAAEHGVDRREAERQVCDTDATRARFIKSHFGKDVNDPFLYDVSLNVAKVTADRAADVLARLVADLDVT